MRMNAFIPLTPHLLSLVGFLPLSLSTLLSTHLTSTNQHRFSAALPHFFIFQFVLPSHTLGHRMYPKLVDQIAGGIAKVVQKATDSHAFHEFPECSALSQTDRLSIKLKDPQVHRSLALPNWNPDAAQLDAIAFVVRDEDHRKRELMSAQLQSANGGLALKNAAGKSVMLIRLPVHSHDSLGKLMHPSQATLFKLMRDPMGPNYSLVKASSDEAPVLRVERVGVSLQSVGKAIGLLGSSCVYYLKAPDGHTVLGYVRTKLVLNSNTLVVKFVSTQRDVQLRAAMLGVALLLTIAEVYPQLRTVLFESTQQNSPSS